MKYLLDTHTFIWVPNQNPRLSVDAKKIIENADNEVFVSIVSLWEIAIKVSMNMLILPSSFEEFIEKERKLSKIQLLNLTPEHLQISTILPFVSMANGKQHKDPFDRMIISVAQSEQIPVISTDQNFPFYPNLKVIW